VFTTRSVAQRSNAFRAVPLSAVPPCSTRVLSTSSFRTVPARTARLYRIWQKIWQTLGCRISALAWAFEQVGVLVHRAGHVADVHDAVVGDVDHDDDSSNGSGSGDGVSVRHDP